jgi:glyoxylase-like metal-dependent hydrolase (beta-lactamase superfamily II)/predicted ester cyclase
MSTSDIAKRYFAALDAHDLDAATALWVDGAIDRFVGGEELIAPDGVRRYFAELYGAFPDFSLEIIELTTARNRTAVRWRATGTFAGPGMFQGLAPNGARLELEGCDVLTVENELITHNNAYVDTGAIARSLGVLPPAGSAAEQRFARLANSRTRMVARLHGHSEAAPVADGVWIVRGGFPLKEMNVYLIEDDGGVTVFDAGISDMTASVAAAAARLGGIKRVVLGHADADHRGSAPGLGAPVYCHAAEREAAESDDSFRPYFDLAKLNAVGRFLLSRLLPVWDGGAVQVAGEVKEGDDIAGFKVIDLPGHAPGLVGLYRESDRLALTSDCFYTLNPQTSIKGPPRVPHPAFDIDVEQARASIRRVAELEPAAAWPGHADPVTGDVRAQLERAAAAPVP